MTRYGDIARVINGLESPQDSLQTHTDHYFPCAVALRLTSCSPRWTALLPPSPLRSLLLKSLTPAPRRQDHTTSPYASRALVVHTHRVHRIPPRVRDDRERPSFGW